MQTLTVAPQQVTLYFPLSRLDGKPDNGPLNIAAALNEHGFAFTSGSVSERIHEQGIERTLTLSGSTPAVPCTASISTSRTPPNLQRSSTARS
jgi:hypothetical protein